MMNIRKYSVLVALMMIVTCGQSAASRFEENEKPGDKSLPSDNRATAKTLVARKSGFVFIDGDKLKEFGK